MKITIEIPDKVYSFVQKVWKDVPVLDDVPFSIICKSIIDGKINKSGQWEYVQYDTNPVIGNYHCSECRFITVNTDPIKQKFNFCPKCGAEMKRSESKSICS